VDDGKHTTRLAAVLAGCPSRPVSPQPTPGMGLPRCHPRDPADTACPAAVALTWAAAADLDRSGSRGGRAAAHR